MFWDGKSTDLSHQLPRVPEPIIHDVLRLNPLTMRTVDLIGYYRRERSKTEAKHLREAGNAPCVLYGGKENKHFHVPMILFRDLIYTPEAAFVNLDIEGDEHRCILQDVQYHPVSEVILHADFLELQNDKEVKMDIPVRFKGTAPGITKGGKLVQKLRKVTVKGLPDQLPQQITVDISDLELGKSIRVSAIEAEGFTISNNPQITLATIAIPRALKSARSAAGAEGEEAKG
jgi:large subunit ribosomal protein L25